jgi:23S rRNA pseudouridine2605 synthase
MRLNKYLSQAGVASRRKADELIARGHVVVNGIVADDFSTDVNEKDIVVVKGKVVMPGASHTYVAMNKPEGIVTTMADFHKDEANVMELLPSYLPNSLKPVGRLDKDSTGLLLFTDDGDLAHELTHPSFEHEKEYIVTCSSAISDTALEQLRVGVTLEEGKTAPATVTRINPKQFRIIIRQGWKRQIRRMVGAVGGNLSSLQRVRIGKLMLDSLHLAPGETKNIRKEDIV